MNLKEDNIKKVTYYKKLLRIGSSDATAFLKALEVYYAEKPFVTNLINTQNQEMVIFRDALNPYLEEYEKLSKMALNLRTSKFSDYLSSGYLVSEINSSLRVEGVRSSQKIIEQIIKSKKQEGVVRTKGEVDKLIFNMLDSMSLILDSSLDIKEKNIFLLYSILTKGIDKNIIEEKYWYRKGEVTIGNDKGAPGKIVEKMMQELCVFINGEDELPLIFKALISHYYFELIHPYYDFNGRMGRLIHLWVLIKEPNEFWKNIYLSEAIYSLKDQYDAVFNKYLYAKKKDANIDLTYFVGKMLEIFNTHTKAYIRMKKMEITSKVKLPRMTRLFIIDMLVKTVTDHKWFTLKHFSDIYEGYSNASAQKVLRILKQSGLCEFKNEKPVRFRLKFFEKQK